MDRLTPVCLLTCSAIAMRTVALPRGCVGSGVAVRGPACLRPSPGTHRCSGAGGLGTPCPVGRALRLRPLARMVCGGAAVALPGAGRLRIALLPVLGVGGFPLV